VKNILEVSLIDYLMDRVVICLTMGIIIKENFFLGIFMGPEKYNLIMEIF
jgi:hypothetical protein